MNQSCGCRPIEESKTPGLTGRRRRPTRHHHQAVPRLRHRQTLPGGGVPQPPSRPLTPLIRLLLQRFPAPFLVAAGPVAAVQDHVVFAVVEAGVVAAHLAVLGEHPVLVSALQHSAGKKFYFCISIRVQRF